jgi:hypothetical protein
MEVPADLNAFVADARAKRANLPALEMVVETYSTPGTDVSRNLHRWDGHGSSRDAADGEDVGWIRTNGRTFEHFAGRWHEYWPSSVDIYGGWTLELPDTCATGWEHRGFDLILDRPTHHLVCGLDEYWVDDEWRLVLRIQHDPDVLGIQTTVEEVVDVTFREQPAELFELPPGADVFCPKCPSPAGSSPTPTP